MADLVTICIPTYRRPTQLFYAVHSCLQQDYRPLEIDIGDDSPNGDSAALIASIALPADVTLRYTRNIPARGQNGNVDSLLQNARGERLVLLHDDDALLPGAVTVLSSAFTTDSAVVAAYGQQQMISENGEAFPPGRSEEHNRHFKRTASEAGLRYDTVVCALWRQFPNNAFMVETEVARAVGYRSVEEVGAACDTDFGVRLALQTTGRPFYFFSTAVSQYRFSAHAQSASRDLFFRLFTYLRNIRPTLKADEVVALDAFLTDIASRAMIESAIRGERIAALQIFLSRYYPSIRRYSFKTVLYHVGVLLLPSIEQIRRRQRQLPQ